MKIYVYDNALLGDSGDRFAAALIATHDGESNDELLAWFNDNYGSNDYSVSFTAP